ncbi:MAG TPA: hypothetical protein VFJ47_15930, partial [Terriglobales bacterium]|nr:hypothetical protein [Terriglobales bacterium]
CGQAAVEQNAERLMKLVEEINQLLLEKEQGQKKPHCRLHILSVSHDQTLLRARHLMLEREGYEVVSVVSFHAALELCKRGAFGVIVLGHSMPHSEKLQLVKAFRQTCLGSIIALRRNPGEQLVSEADYHIEPDPEPLLKLIAGIARNRGEESGFPSSSQQVKQASRAS